MSRARRRWLVGQVIIWGLGIAVLRVAVVPGESCPPISRGSVRTAIDAGADWLVRGQRPDGRFLYAYDSQSDRASSEYNTTRHAGVIDALYRSGRVHAADAGLRYARERMITTASLTAFAPADEDASAGANALLLAALLHRRQLTGDQRLDALAHGIARFLVSQTQPDGSVLQFWSRSTRQPVPDVFGKFSTGETFYALALMNEAFPGEGWDADAHRIALYLATRRDEAEGYALRQPDHWAAYGLAELSESGLTEAEAEYARWLAGYFGYLVRFDSQHVGRFLGGGLGSGAGLGVVGEGTAALWRAAGADPELADLRAPLAERVRCEAGILVARQTPAADPNPNERGAWFKGSYTQMDDQQHAIAALIATQDVLR
jgi:hypothetical protein